ncbi:MAG TPA: DUF885 domain-containing protein [Verrucomicrobiae bacterium]|nr:DUF885 domain-containing protein [Verrucomicrobiae bacterium]
MNPKLRQLTICWVCLQLSMAVVPIRGAELTFDAWADSFAVEWVRGDPMLATTTQYFEDADQDEADRQLTPVTREYRKIRVALARRGLDELGRFDPASLSRGQKVSASMLRWQLNDIVRGYAYDDLRLVFQQFSGLQVELVNFLSQTHPIRTRRDIQNYLVRLRQVSGVMDDGIEIARDRGSRGFVAPDFILKSTIAQFDRFLSGSPGDNVLVRSLSERSATIKELNPDDREKFIAEATRIVGDSVIPAFKRARELLQDQLALAKPDAGLWRFAQGEEAYADALKRSTTTEMTAAQIHELGLKEVTRIELEMNGLLGQLGYREGTIKERLDKLQADSQPPADPDPRPALLDRYGEILQDAEKRAGLIFDLRPKAPVEVRREPPFTEKNAAAHYTIPAKDGSRPGIFWAPLPGPIFPILSMRTLVYHEAVPGHHFQIALQNEMTDLPQFRRDRAFGFLSAFGEGWALYAEQLAAESGWYENDPKGRLGQLSAELFRARRLVVDTGIHAFHWTRQRAIDYGIDASEVERYVVWPGQACSYKIGMLKILELRSKAQKALGKKFSLKQFHNTVLGTGTVPLSVLEQAVQDYIADNQ